MTEAFLDWLKKSSIRGANYLKDQDESKPWQKFWGFLIFSGSIVAFVNITLIFVDYGKYPYFTQLKEFVYYRSPEATTHYAQSHFPALTICNLKALSGDSTLPNGVLSYRDYLTLVQSNLSNSESFKRFEIYDQDYQSIKSTLLSKEGYFSYLGTERAAKLGQSLENLVVSCKILTRLSWSKTPCDHIMIYQRTLNTYFNCFTFQFDANSIDIEHLPMGYELTLYLDTNRESLPPHLDKKPVEDIGIRATVHPPDQFPHVWAEGHSLDPGKHHTIQVRTHLRHRLGWPYTREDCEEEAPGSRHWHSQLYDLSGHKLKYSHDADTMACINEAVIAHCHCVDSTIPVVRLNSSLGHILCGDVNSRVIPIVTTTGARRDDMNGGSLPGTTCAVVRLDCAQRMRHLKSPECARKSKLRCSEVTYTNDVTATSWPHPLHQLDIYNASLRDKPYSGVFRAYDDVQTLVDAGQEGDAVERLLNMDLIAKNCLRLTVVVPETTAVKSIDDPKFTFWILMANLGGAGNMWAGISVFLVLEFLVFIFRNVMCQRFLDNREIPVRLINDADLLDHIE